MAGLTASDLEYGSSGFKSVTKLKSQVVLQVLKLGYDATWTDTDIVWFKNPLPVYVAAWDEERSPFPMLLSSQATCILFPFFFLALSLSHHPLRPFPGLPSSRVTLLFSRMHPGRRCVCCGWAAIAPPWVPLPSSWPHLGAVQQEHAANGPLRINSGFYRLRSTPIAIEALEKVGEQP